MTVSSKSRLSVWTLSGGNCQFAGCNKPLLGDLVSGKRGLNKAYIAHIVAEEPGGPRGHIDLSPELADDPGNLMLLCDPHHRLIDIEAVEEYPVSRLQGMKRRHEARIAAVTALGHEGASHVVLYGAKVGEHDCPARFDLAQRALLAAGRWSAEPRATHLALSGLAMDDHEASYWAVQAENLDRQFDAHIRPRLAHGEMGHLSVFALAPQPLLIRLGTLLGDIIPAAVFQLHREPQGWDWRDGRPPIAYDVCEPVQPGAVVALKLSLSATLSDVRVRAVLGADAAIWSVSTPEPHNDIMHRADDLANFRKVLRTVYDRIKARHGEDAVIHLFPALPVSAAIEVGRVWMPKADLPLLIYDQCRRAGGFAPRLLLSSTGHRSALPALESLDG